MGERHLRQHRDDLAGGMRRERGQQRRAGRRAGITSFGARSGLGRGRGGQGRAGLRCRCCVAAGFGPRPGLGGGQGGPRGHPGGHPLAEQDAQAVPPSAVTGGRGAAQLLIPAGERAAVITGGIPVDGAGLVRGFSAPPRGPARPRAGWCGGAAAPAPPNADGR
jgi:hypothetical protein